MSSVTNAMSAFVSSIIGVFVSLFNLIFAVFHAIFASAADMLSSVFAVGRHFVLAVLQLFQGMVGFITGNLLGIVLIVGLYYLYTVRNRRRGVRGAL
ncbi:hypothetical protein M413DRAFT_22913 [Hebeloma cylindrosporum]|uniref:Uncharacterized protein n=1 Tax=Hebeloma cylindrosporum TaxID=76867 RepID=A0A0C3CX33_HEBCY|nr:hypothetical protein M413DRAFT_22913 [Hebeloma cylindrosporum h7]